MKLPFLKRNNKHDLRNKCKELYGEEFVELYDKLGSGETIGSMLETVWFLELVERARIELERDK